jgi:hypothetical protein
MVQPEHAPQVRLSQQPGGEIHDKEDSEARANGEQDCEIAPQMRRS